MLRLLPLLLLLTACGDAADPAVVTDTDVAVVDATADPAVVNTDVTDADRVADPTVADAPAQAPSPADGPESAAAPAPVTSTAMPSSSKQSDSTPIPAALASLPGDTIYSMDDDPGDTIQFRVGASRTSGEYTRTPNPAIDPFTGTWSIEGDKLFIDGAPYTFDAASGQGHISFVDGPNGDMLLTISTG